MSQLLTQLAPLMRHAACGSGGGALWLSHVIAMVHRKAQAWRSCGFVAPLYPGGSRRMSLDESRTVSVR